MAQKIDVEKIMDEIRADIERRELDDTLVPFDEIPFSNEIMNVLPDSHAYSRKELRRNLLYAADHYKVPLDRVIEAGNAGAMTVKKAVRKFTRFYIKPVVEDQNSVNAALVNALRQERNYIQIQEQAVRELKERVAALETEIAELKKNDRAALETEIAELKKNGRAALETEIAELKKNGRAALEAEIAAGRPEAENAAGRPEDGEQRTEENSSRNLKKTGRSTGTKPKYFK